jgi:hypothetical protein
MPAAELPPCIFCGEPIGPGEETAGRLPAHAACADAALADDAHWDAIHAAGGGEDVGEAEEASPVPAGRSGCLTLGALLLVILLVAVLL